MGQNRVIEALLEEEEGGRGNAPEKGVILDPLAKERFIHGQKRGEIGENGGDQRFRGDGGVVKHKPYQDRPICGIGANRLDFAHERRQVRARQ